jgi:DNA processing protein
VSDAGHPRACGDCLRRAWLIGSLSGHIERAVDKSIPGRRAHELLALSNEDLAEAMARSAAREFLERASSRDPERLLAAVAGARAWACCRHDGLYPRALADLGDAPAVLFGRGDHGSLAGLAASDTVTIVGSRRPSSYGRELATKLGREVAAAGIAVVSGMAMGIDSRAHAGALDAGGLTIAVLGTGVDVPYPARAARLYEEIADRGLVLSELPPGTTARRWTFPARNRIMAALGGMTIVVEARDRSGSLITAEMAQDLSREVGAVPGRVGSSPAAGTNGLLRDGASVIRGGDDVLDSMLGVGRSPRDGFNPRGPALAPDLEAVLDQVERGATSADALARACGLEPGPLSAALVRLELSGYLRSDSGGRYERTAVTLPEPAQARH